MKGTWSENPFQREWKASSSKTRTIEKEIQKQMLRGALVADPFQPTAKKKKKKVYNSEWFQHKEPAGEYPWWGQDAGQQQGSIRYPFQRYIT